VVLTWENPATTVFIEAKYGSGLSTGTANGDGRFPTDQLVRNIRVGLNACGYFADDLLFQTPSRDLAVVLFTPDRGNSLVERYRNPERLRQAIPSGERLNGFPRSPFVGELGYRDVVQVLTANRRFFGRAERAMIDGLTEYLDFKKDQLQTFGRKSSIAHRRIPLLPIAEAT
jgi:hypothetical protein